MVFIKERARARMRELSVSSVFLRSSFGKGSVKVQSDNGVVTGKVRYKPVMNPS